MNLTKLVLDNKAFKLDNQSNISKVIAIGPQNMMVINKLGRIEKISTLSPCKIYTNIRIVHNMLGDPILDMLNCYICSTKNGFVYVCNEYQEQEIKVVKTIKAISIDKNDPFILEDL